MTKITQPGTIKDALRKAMGILTLERAAVIIGKSESYIYELGNPDSEKNISAEDAIALDLACLAEKEPPPFASVWRVILDAADPRERVEISELLLNAQAALGLLTKALIDARLPESEGGREFTPNERKRLYDGAMHLMAKAEEVIHALGIDGRKTADRQEAA